MGQHDHEYDSKSFVKHVNEIYLKGTGNMQDEDINKHKMPQKLAVERLAIGRAKGLQNLPYSS
jgi:hypothetical protein